MQTNSVKTGENRLQSIKYFDLIFSNRIYSKKKNSAEDEFVKKSTPNFAVQKRPLMQKKITIVHLLCANC